MLERIHKDEQLDFTLDLTFNSTLNFTFDFTFDSTRINKDEQGVTSWRHVTASRRHVTASRDNRRDNPSMNCCLGTGAKVKHL